MAQQTEKPNGLIAKSGIELLTWSTPNGFRVAALLEELKEAYGKEYTFQAIDLRERVQKEPWFTNINPNGTIPVLVDHDKDGHVVFESTAILNYLINNYDPEHKFSFKDPLEADTATQWLIWLHSGLGVHQSQANKFYRFHSERLAYPTQHYIGEVERLYGVLNARLASRDYIAGPGRGSYSAVDISAWPIIDAIGVSGIELEKFPNVYNYWSRLSERPALQKGCMVPSGKPFPFGYKALREMKDMDPRAYEERERPFREALERAQREFGYVYKSS